MTRTQRMILFVSFLFLTSVAQNNPCDDSLYLHLKSIPLEEMTERQYSYFLQKDKYCIENYTSKAGKVKSTEMCTLEVKADRYTFEDSQDQFNPEVYIDDNRMGIPPQTIIVTSGEHTISLIPSNQIKWEEGKVLKSKSRIAQLYSLVSKNVFHAGKLYRIHFKFVCNEGDNKKCDGNEWTYTTRISEKQ